MPMSFSFSDPRDDIVFFSPGEDPTLRVYTMTVNLPPGVQQLDPELASFFIR